MPKPGIEPDGHVSEGGVPTQDSDNVPAPPEPTAANASPAAMPGSTGDDQIAIIKSLAGPWSAPTKSLKVFQVQDRRTMTWFRWFCNLPLTFSYNLAICGLWNMLLHGCFSQSMRAHSTTVERFVQVDYSCKDTFMPALFLAFLCIGVLVLADFVWVCLAFATINVGYLSAIIAVLCFTSIGLAESDWPCDYRWNMSMYFMLVVSLIYWCPRLCMSSQLVAKFYNLFFSCMTFEINGSLKFLWHLRNMIFPIKDATGKTSKVEQGDVIGKKNTSTQPSSSSAGQDSSADNQPREIQDTLTDRAEKALREESLKLLSARRFVWRYFRTCLSRNKQLMPIRKRQDLERDDPNIFLSPEQAVACFKKHAGVIAISYPWITSEHPDPDMFHLKIILQIVPVFLLYHFMVGSFDIGIFWDFPCMPQGPERTEEEEAKFSKGIKAINILYGSPRSMVLQLRDMPTEDAKTRYETSGWCTFEAEVSRMVKPLSLIYDEVKARDIRLGLRSWRTRIGRNLFRGVIFDLVMLVVTALLVGYARWNKSQSLFLKIGIFLTIELALKTCSPVICKKKQRICPAKSFLWMNMAFSLCLLFVAMHVHSKYTIEDENLRADANKTLRAWGMMLIIHLRIMSFLDALFAFTRDQHEIFEVATSGNHPPLHPDTMKVLLGTKKFTNHADLDFVCRKYASFFYEMANQATVLDLSGRSVYPGTVCKMSWGPRDAQMVARVLELFTLQSSQKHHVSVVYSPLQRLSLDWHFLGDDGMTALAEALPCELNCLSLHATAFGEAGMMSLAKALKEKCPHLKSMTLPSYLACSKVASQIEGARGTWKNMYGFHFWGYQEYFCDMLFNVINVRLGRFRICF